MKKLIVFALVASMLLTLASCALGGNKNPGNETDTTTPQSTTITTPNDDVNDTTVNDNVNDTTTNDDVNDTTVNDDVNDTTTNDDVNDTTTNDDVNDTTANNGGNDTPTEGYDYNAFTESENQMFTDLFGVVIPFIPNNGYYVEEYSTPSGQATQKGIIFIAYDNTQEEFDAYRELFSNYAYSDTSTDESGNVSYLYAPEDQSYAVMLSYFESEGRYAIQVYVYKTISNGSGIPYDRLFTNEGAGLPSDPDGIYDLDFTKGEYVKDVTNQALYLDGCPTVGSPGVLVIPVQFSDVTAESKGYTTNTIVEALSKGGKTDYYSLYDYYYISSYGQLTLDITVLDFWFTPEHNSTYYSQFSFMYNGENISQGEQLIINEALDYLDDIMDLSQFDSDSNGTIDSIILINTLDIDSSTMFYWAFRYFNFYLNESGSFYVYDGVCAKDYIWTPYRFLYEVSDEQGNRNYDNVTGVNTHTYIHEFGHVLGLEDYYSYTGLDFPLYGFDIMDSKKGDHNAYSKFNLGWLTKSRLVVADGSITVTLEDFTKSGDTIIIANNWDDKLGAYQEYYVLLYYTHNGVNVGDDSGYFKTEGILVYHVNAALYMDEGKDHYDVYNKNTDVSHYYGTENNLIELVLSTNDYPLYGVGDTMSSVSDDYGNELIYNFTVDELTGEYATITFSKK